MLRKAGLRYFAPLFAGCSGFAGFFWADQGISYSERTSRRQAAGFCRIQQDIGGPEKRRHLQWTESTRADVWRQEPPPGWKHRASGSCIGISAPTPVRSIWSGMTETVWSSLKSNTGQTAPAARRKRPSPLPSRGGSAASRIFTGSATEFLPGSRSAMT